MASGEYTILLFYTIDTSHLSSIEPTGYQNKEKYILCCIYFFIEYAGELHAIALIEETV
jgi:hypothetical protein